MTQLNHNDWLNIYNINDDNNIYVSLSNNKKYYIKQNNVTNNNYILQHEYNIIQHIQRHYVTTAYDYIEYKYNNNSNIEYLAVQYIDQQYNISNIKLTKQICVAIITSLHQLHTYHILHVTELVIECLNQSPV